MLWSLLAEICKDLLKSLIVKLVLFAAKTFFDNYCKPQRTNFA
jgi:hypothetical protein